MKIRKPSGNANKSRSQLRFKKHYVWLGEEAAVPVSELTHYLRGEKPDVAHPTAAWSSKTGKGLLYLTKNSETKEKPTGVINLVSSPIARQAHGLPANS